MSLANVNTVEKSMASKTGNIKITIEISPHIYKMIGNLMHSNPQTFSQFFSSLIIDASRRQLSAKTLKAKK